MATPEYSIALRAPGGVWEQVGAGALSDVIPENIVHTHGPRGPETLSFQLRRDGRIYLPDELPFTEVATMVGGVPAWSGRLMRTPRSRGLESVVSPVAEGWFLSHLQDYPMDREWAIDDLSRFMDVRSSTSAPLGVGSMYAGAQVNVGDGGITLMSPSQLTLVNGGLCGAYIDLGPSNNAARAVITYASSANTANQSLRLYGSSSSNPYAGSTGSTDVTNVAAASGTLTCTFGAGTRYVYLLSQTLGATYTPGADVWFKITSVKIFTDTADESGGSSALKASTVITESLALAPKISTDTSLVTPTTFSIPAYGTGGRRAIGDICNDVNAYHQYQFYGTTDPTPRPVYRPIPTTPTWVIDESKGYEYDDAGANEGAEIYDTVIMQYQDAAGVPAEYIATTTQPILNRAGYSRAKVLQARSKMTAAAAQQIATAYLAAYSSSPFKGKVSLKGTITRYTDGTEIPVGLIPYGDAVVLSSEIDPDTGAFGRIGIIQDVTYTHDQLKADLTLDSSRNYMDAILERLAVVSR